MGTITEIINQFIDENCEAAKLMNPDYMKAERSDLVDPEELAHMSNRLCFMRGCEVAPILQKMLFSNGNENSIKNIDNFINTK